MRQFSFLFFFFFIVGFCSAQKVATPDEIYGALFTDVQMSGIFPDSKTFVDCIPKRNPQQIVKDYIAVKNNPAIRFSLELFVEANFIIPQNLPTQYKTTEKNITQHIENLWTVLQRKSDSVVEGSSLLPLPYNYIVPGGRFREVYYWDSYFTMLGLKESKRYDLVESMVKNFAYLINTYGHIPNGNRSYYLSRSQPPFFSLMVDLLAAIKGHRVYINYLPALEKEYSYWMDETDSTHHVITMPDGSFLNRYWDQLSIPRQEAYKEDVTVAQATNYSAPEQKKLYKNLRSAAESGWDFSSRWLNDGKTLATIQTTNFIPVDLNCLLYHLEATIAHAAALSGDAVKEKHFRQYAGNRKTAIKKYCWSAGSNWFTDYNLNTGQPSPTLTLAGMFPFFLHVGSDEQFAKAKPLLQNKFLKPGGLVTTLTETGQQWDAPNGWAPLQWIGICGLENYGAAALAKDVSKRWVALNKKVFAATGKLMEKYDVVNTSRPAGGGEYPSQDGFGWTNGVLLALMHHYNLHE